ncbi:S1C family serine protease [Conexibacter sp. CPCC 206217]|uniref:S1C family serine protease n=1 Tax=Conexibacter sp. CPCC 206217 TaxID=3064574 RepID=UPI00271AA23E|nr:trypsin-like peptidase domain-containing protein [Conexibacter sp. CPCC 206217]MDO8213368.1 trypsin-like peptidase domain-containing protein [Conexibacter sp. CPCC 206217]
MGSPRHLWTGEWRAESDQARDDGATALHRTPPPRPASDAGSAPEQPERKPRRGSFVLLAILIALVAAGGGVAAALTLFGGGDDGPPPLPALSSRPIRPQAGQTRAGAIYALTSPAVVSISTQTGQGTGFLIDARGTLVTNYHVVGTSNHVVVKFGQDGASIDGDVLGTDESSDLAVVSIEPDRIPRGVRALSFADSRNVSVGDFAVAIGNPFGLDRTVTEGIVSGLGRSITAPNGFEIDEVIQTDAPINPGNSGGPLLDSGGHVIGVNSQIATSGMGQAGNIGIGFAVPSNTARQIVPKLQRGERISRPYLGVSTQPTTLTGASAGARVAEVRRSGPAERAGIRVGDVLKRVNGMGVQEPADVAASISRSEPGQRVQVELERGGRDVTLDVTLGDRADAP